MTNEREQKVIQNAVQVITDRIDFEVEVGMILGSGLGDYADRIEDPLP